MRNWTGQSFCKTKGDPCGGRPALGSTFVPSAVASLRKRWKIGELAAVQIHAPGRRNVQKALYCLLVSGTAGVGNLLLDRRVGRSHGAVPCLEVVDLGSTIGVRVNASSPSSWVSACSSQAPPASQAADIKAFRATLVPVGSDQLPMIEQSNEIVRAVNRLASREILPQARALLSEVGHLPGVDGKAKMSKSLGNALALGATADEIRAAVRRVYTDPQHLRAEDPGHLEGNVAFAYLDAFDEDLAGLQDLKQRYTTGGVGDVVVKRRLEDCLQRLLGPIRARRAQCATDPGQVLQMLREGSRAAREAAAATLAQVKAGFGLGSF